MKSRVLERYERAFAARLGVKGAFAFWKGRVAAYAILKALGVGEGDEVVVPGYTCVMAVNPIVYLGAKPVFVDIEPVTYNIDVALLARSITPRTKCIMAQHTYGYPADMDAIMDIADGKGLPVVEDCCLALGSEYNRRLVGTFGAAAYFSFQWNKPYTSGLGGMAVTGNPELGSRIEALQRESIIPGTKEVMMLAAQLAVYRTLVYPRTTALAQNIFRSLGKAGLVVGSSSSGEFVPVMPDGFFKRMSELQARSGRRQLQALSRNIAHRRRLARLYDDRLRELGWPVPRLSSKADPALVRYPVRVVDKQRALATAAKRFVELGSWFECPLHPIETPMDAYGYHTGMCPEADKASREVVNLPLHPRADEGTVRRSVHFIAGIGPPAPAGGS
ncbi:MAG: DegT/DnrJ/EryC1/StrS family aminotransferase [Phycisphaerales bacterium]|nr:MAG: DegT/DnrJ/EryC1/StrS family aminotransferase [Phycisphaerales bacterium]